MSVYNPATIGPADMEALLARLDRYLARHGSPYGDNPIPADTLDDVRQGIILDWLGDDWTAREFEYLSRNGRTLFPASLSPLGQHLRGLLFHAGRARRRHWRAEGAKRGEASRRRGLEDFRGAGSASRAADPALVVAAVESATGALVLSKSAAAARAKRGLPLKYRGGLAVTPDDAPAAFRVMKRRNAGGWILEIVSRHPDRTCIQFTRWTRFNFERVGKVPNRVADNAHYRPTLGIGRVLRTRPNPARAKSVKRLPGGARVAEALRGLPATTAATVCRPAPRPIVRLTTDGLISRRPAAHEEPIVLEGSNRAVYLAAVADSRRGPPFSPLHAGPTGPAATLAVADFARVAEAYRAAVARNRR